MWPKHSNPTETRSTRAGRGRPNKEVRAVAPYNFVPLADDVVSVDSIPLHDRHTGNTGYITCKLTTLTPLYTRAAMSPKRFNEWSEKIRDMMGDDVMREEYAQFFHHSNVEEPMIPGSSLRGMVRNIMEIASSARMPWVTSKQLFFRTVDNSSVGIHYRDRMMDNVEAGILRKQGNRYFIVRCEYVRIHRDKLGNNARNNLYDGRAPNKTPKWSGTHHQYQQVWVTLTKSGYAVDDIQYRKKSGYQEGTLVITGDMPGRPGKQKEFVFLKPMGNPEQIDVSSDLLEQFQDDDQITLWQQKAFPTDKPNHNQRRRKGYLSTEQYLENDGDPVFFLREEGQLAFFGRAQMFRLPYKNSPNDFVPDELKRSIDKDGKEVVDLVEAIFGYVPEKERKSSRAGRVFFGDARCLSTDNLWLEANGNVITPAILASPKPTTFQHYLIQSESPIHAGKVGESHNPDVKDGLAHYGTPTPQETVIRGYKIYWHKRSSESVTSDSIRAQNPPRNWATDTQHTQIRPVKAGVCFEFRIYFENLHEHELGALLWALKLPITSDGQECRHKLGMGKPLGLGSVQVETQTTITNRCQRYERLFWNDGWYKAEESLPQTEDNQEPNTAKSESALMRLYEQFMMKRLTPSMTEESTFSKQPRIATLARLLAWPGPPDELTRYMEIKRVDPDDDSGNSHNEFSARPVLPDPFHLDQKLSPDTKQKWQQPASSAPRAQTYYTSGKSNADTSGTSQIDPAEVIKHINAGGNPSPEADNSDFVDQRSELTQIVSYPKSLREIERGMRIEGAVSATTFQAITLNLNIKKVVATLARAEMETEGEVQKGDIQQAWVLRVQGKKVILTQKPSSFE